MLPYRNMTLILTNACNLACTYCYVKKQSSNIRHMSHEMLLASLSWFTHHLMKQKEKEGGIIHFGGEPLLKHNLIRDAVSYSDIVREEHGISLSHLIISNGTLLDASLIDFIIRNNIRLQISVDGKPECHNHNRRSDENKPSHNKLHILNSLGDYIKSGLDITANLVYTDVSINNLYNNLLYLVNCGFKKIRIRPVIGMMDNWDNDIIEREISKVIKYMHEQPHLRIFPFSNYPKAIEAINSTNDIERLNSEVPCLVARNNFCVGQTGDIYPCHRFYFLKNNSGEFCFGNVRGAVNYDNLDKFISAQPRNVGKCSECTYKYVCDNQCLCAFYQETGSLIDPAPHLCKLSKTIWNTYLSLK